ncbi:glycerophosphodiester phosphodiesterase [Streptoalloteichus hindustanus]|uniref:glycerophosphodiester phosphodiesterase n=1 Tax=Streptoalloteichus hindustanus TaxID=2017 RepID=A0A1M4UE52_STRHI|nr:glycerophosphodiester phosphodiesterase [Streptoalloteichus hindustanus]SHE55042.1 glycerophosphoryl diester phosphodiesterase [Streptoalloteichus hindustanus]
MRKAMTTRLTGAVVSAMALVGVTSLPSAVAEPSAAEAAHRPSGPLVIGHRGASGYRPEHTLASYELAARMGADYIEPDLVPTRDGVLVARHENEIGGTTDVASRPEFAARKTTKTIDGQRLTGWFTEDFTLAELKTLRAKERIPQHRPRNTLYDGRYEVPTFQEVIDLARRLSRELRRDIGIYPETKHPTYFRKAGLALEPRLVEALNRNGLNRPGAKVFVQSFEVSNLKELRRHLRVPLVQLIDESGAPADFVDAGDRRTYDDLVTPAGLAEIAKYAKGVGPSKSRVIPRDDRGFLKQPTTLVRDAHARGLVVHPWTFRNENAFLPADFRGSTNPADYGRAFAEYELFLKQGVDGVFSDNPDTAVAARAERA